VIVRPPFEFSFKRETKVDSHTPFYLARIVNRAGDLAEILLLVQPQIIRASIARWNRCELVSVHEIARGIPEDW